MSLPERLKAVRAALGLTQKEFAAQSGVSPRGYQGYEDGRSVPGGEAIEGLVRAGVNANWLLTGEGPMLRSELEEAAVWRARAGQLQADLDAAAQAIPLNETAMRAIIIGVLEDPRYSGAEADRIAARAVQLYRRALDDRLITATGVGEGKNKAA
ncbi:helix-turn-helix transcriptional regulator [Pseudothauera nasutitermitis]|uniref:Helix-turn-helix transcriptional regulator n=1 Tax=Pseudothauera nasutitermitis TaxID=2565930 RepID=A0A4S4AVW4_9RHOO|nr:helix-turn-helix transcriptional regulator [Pseudothauera nasutitermitis]THF63740.1 helix-turn-helix transcriptional regulator [Pseudothauera nasutitermitis]